MRLNFKCTEFESDHVFKEVGLPTVAHSKTRQRIKEMQNLSWTDSDLEQRLLNNTEIPFAVDAIKKEFGNERNIELALPALTFGTSLTMHLGDISSVVEHVGGDHADDATILFYIIYNVANSSNMQSKKSTLVLTRVLYVTEIKKLVEDPEFAIGQPTRPPWF